MFEGLFEALWKAIAYCTLSHKMTPEPNPALCEVLDTDGSVATASEDKQPDVPSATTQYEEHVLRLRAEAEAQDKANRLRVAQEQLAEYATDKATEAAGMLQQAELVESCIRQLLKQSDSNQDVPSILSQLEKLKQSVLDHAVEAKAFATQQRADVDRAKRSSQQAELPADGMDVEMKRPREAEAETLEEADAPAEEEAAPLTPPDRATSTNGAAAPALSTSSWSERARYIPVRLSMEERRLLRLLEAALHVSEYTDKVDVVTWKGKTQRVHAQIRDLCAILCGLVVAQNYKRGQELITDKSFSENADFFQDVFEIGRRHKVMNPEKMRSEYGKLMYMLMDSAEPSIQELLEFKCVRPLRTVYVYLEERGALAMLDDPLMELATAEIHSGGRSRMDVQRDIRNKERARESLSKKYRNTRLTEENILWCLYSLSDNNSYLLFNRDPIDRMIDYFTANFHPTNIEQGMSLAIQGGREGARLTHSHERQYNYVLQSLTLWREISTEMFRLWLLAESDMLREGNHYRLCDTGQGLNRVQSAPSVSKAIHGILARCQQRIGSWVGSSVVHLGDHNVPNALMFIDKYTQVPRILTPVVLVLDELPKLCRDPELAAYVEAAFGSVEDCRRAILLDFCRHAFDGSGADNFFDAGSCIDGRLTSAWNWCSKIEKKEYFHVFRLAGFQSFDGDWQK